MSRSPRAERLLDAACALAVAMPALLLYVSCLSSSVGIGDVAEYQYQINVLGVPHPTGTPLFVFLTRLFVLLPFETPAWRVNLAVAVYLACAVLLCYAFVRMVGGRRPAAMAGAAMFALAPIPWYWGVFAKTYGLQITLYAALFIFAIAYARRQISLAWLALATGIAFGNHRGIVLIMPAFALFLLLARRPGLRDLIGWHAARAGVAFALPWLMYLYIPIQGIPGREGFWDTLVYGASGTALIWQAGDMSRNVWASAQDLLLRMLPEQFGPMLIPAWLGLAALSARVVRARRPGGPRISLLLWGSIAGICAFHLVVYGGDTTGFFLPVIWILAAGLGFAIDVAAHATERLAKRPVAGAAAAAALGVSALLLGPAQWFWPTYALLNQSNVRVHEARANELLDSLETNASLVLNDDWLALWQVLFQREVMGRRPDVTLLRGDADVISRGLADKGRIVYSMNLPHTMAAEGRAMPVLALWKGLAQPMRWGFGGETHAVFGEAIHLARWQALSDTIEPGGRVPLQLTWVSRQAVDADYVVFVQLLDEAGKSPAGFDKQPLGFESPTSTWRPGQRIEDYHGFVAPATLAPGRYSIQVGFYPEGGSQRLRVRQPGAPEDDRVLLGPFRVASTAPTARPQREIGARFGDIATLQGSSRAGSGRALSVTLYWRSDRQTPIDYTVTVQLLDSAGRLAAQRDRQPADARYPTSIWRPGELVEDAHPLPLERLAPGTYRLIAALYDQAGRRLPVAGGDIVELGSVEVP
jgi:hypothetical protein